jgi:hypothetical protein
MKKFISIIMLMAALLCMSFPAFAEETPVPAAPAAEAAPAAPVPTTPATLPGVVAWSCPCPYLAWLCSKGWQIPGSLNTMAMTFASSAFVSLWVIYGIL